MTHLSRIRTSSPLLAAAALMLASACAGPTDGPDRGAVLYTTCQPCHMADGGGNLKVAAPAIAGLPQWYVEAQLHKFKSDHRGTHPTDLPGQRMRPLAKAMQDDAQIKLVAAHVAGMPLVYREPTLTGGDAEKGKALYGLCASCHGADAKGNEKLNAPGLATSDDWYLLTQLKNFKAGVRGTNPGDVTGAQMRPMSMTLADEQAMKDVVAYIKTQK